MARKRRYNPNLIKGRHCYTFAEVAQLYGVHIGTVQRWRKLGLEVLDPTTKPYLVLGHNVRTFLRKRDRKRRHPLRLGEFFCPRCRCPRRSQFERLSIEVTGKKLGSRANQVLIRGVCTVCSQALVLFSSDRKVQEWREAELLPSEPKKLLIGSGDCSMNADIKGGTECERST